MKRALFYPTLALYHLFPLHAPVTLFFIDAPFGRFSRGTGWNVNGNFAWFCMEIVAPITFVSNLEDGLSPAAKVLSGLYILHYFHRAILSPLVYSPPRSPLHITVPLAAAVFNLINASLLAKGLSVYPPSLTVRSIKFWLAIAGWAVGFAGNVYHDEILNDLRRPAGSRRVLKKVEGEGRYKIPTGGLFRYISFPNYLCEWFEWICFAYAAHSLSIPSPFWPGKLLSPGWAFVLAEVTSMLPRAIRGHRWYKDKFGDKYPQERKAVIPFVL